MRVIARDPVVIREYQHGRGKKPRAIGEREILCPEGMERILAREGFTAIGELPDHAPQTHVVRCAYGTYAVRLISETGA